MPVRKLPLLRRRAVEVFVALLGRVVARDTSRSNRAAVAAAAVGVSIGLAALDYLTGPALSFDAFYVLAVLWTTLAGGFAVGMGAAAVTAVVWAASDALIRSLGLTVWGDLWNGVVRFLALAVVVLLVASLVSTLTAARQSADQSRAFLADAAHQLRTPVAALRASVEALVHTDSVPARDRLLGNAVHESARLGRLITSLLHVARLDSGEPVDMTPVELRPLLAAEVDRMRDLSSLEIGLSVAPDVPAVVRVDAAGTSEALANVLDNARRHAVSRVDVTVTSADGAVAVEVSDDGPGLPPGSERRAFERFVTLDGAGGSGLGLPIAQALAHRQGGDLVYRAKRFVLLLPRGERTRQR